MHNGKPLLSGSALLFIFPSSMLLLNVLLATDFKRYLFFGSTGDEEKKAPNDDCEKILEGMNEDE